MISQDVNPLLARYGFGNHTHERAPKAIPVNLNMIPLALRIANQWVAWDWHPYGERWRKVPISPLFSLYCNDSKPIYGTDIIRAHQYSEAHNLPGIGLIITSDDSFIAIDIDDCVDPRTGIIDDEVQCWIRAIRSYTEISPSGTGVRIIAVQSGKPLTGVKKYGRAEVFASDGFVTITGQILPGSEFALRSVSSMELRRALGGDSNAATPSSGWFHADPVSAIRLHASSNDSTLYTSRYSLHMHETLGGNGDKWQFPLGARNIVGTTMTRDKVVYADDKSRLLAHDRVSGRILWTNKRVGRVVKVDYVPGEPLLIDSDYGQRDTSSGGGCDFRGWKLINEFDGSVVETERGFVAWVAKSHAIRKMPRSLKRSPGFIAASGRHIEGFDRRSGALHWSVSSDPVSDVDQLEWADGYLLTSRFEYGDLTIVDVANRSARVLEGVVDSVSSFVVSDHQVLTAANDVLTCIMLPDGNVLWRNPETSVSHVLGVTAHNRILCSGHSRNGDYYSVFVCDMADGRVIHDFPGEYLDSDNQLVWIQCLDDTVRAFGIDSGVPLITLGLPQDVRLVPPRDEPEDSYINHVVDVIAGDRSCALSNGMVLLKYVW